MSTDIGTIDAITAYEPYAPDAPAFLSAPSSPPPGRIPTHLPRDIRDALFRYDMAVISGEITWPDSPVIPVVHY